MRSIWPLSLSFILAAVGCGGDDDVKPTPRTVDPTNAAIRAAVESNASVALKLHSKLREQPGNLFYSPLSIEAVLGMLYAGAAGDTETQIGAVLGSVDDPQALHEGLGKLLKDLVGERGDHSYTLSLANRIWANEGLQSSADFTAIMRDDYDAPIKAADFREPEPVRAEINDWVAAQTDDHIPELLKLGDITTLTVMTLVNAIYFKASWQTKFDAALTRRGMFERADFSKVEVDMMQLKETKLRFARSQSSTLLELPYDGGDLSFLVYTPEQPEELPILEAGLEEADLDGLIDMLTEGETGVIMPKLTLRSRLDLIPTFQALGVVDLFDDRADLSKIDPAKDVFVKPFVHEAMVQVDEAGTVAAAATAAVVGRKSAPIPITLDHPFLFFIRDNLTGAILFTGRVADPTAD